MFRALSLVLLLVGTATAEDIVEYSTSSNALTITVKGDAERDINITGTRSGGGTVVVAGQSPNYTIPANISDITVIVHATYEDTNDGIDVDYISYTSNDSYRFHVYGSNDPSSTDVIRTGRNHDYINAFGGINTIASGKGGDTIECWGSSYLFTGQAGWFGNTYSVDWVFWDDLCVLYTSESPDYISPADTEEDGLTVFESGPDEGWN